MLSIIVPTDFSENAYSALLYAAHLLNKEPRTIVLIHSFSSQFSVSTSRIDIGRNELLYTEMKSDSMKKLEEVKHRIHRDCESLDIEIELVAEAQPLARIVNKRVVHTNIDFLVMGTKGATGLKEVFLGTQTVALLKKIKPIPVFVVPETDQIAAPSAIAYTTDFKRDYTSYPLSLIKQLMEAQHAHLHIAHIYNQATPSLTVEDNYRKLKERLTGLEFNMHWISSETPMEEALQLFIEKHEIQLLVLIYHKNGFLRRLLKKSFVEKLSFHTAIPLLVLPDSF